MVQNFSKTSIVVDSNEDSPEAERARATTRQHGLLDLALEQHDGITRPTRSLAHPPIQLSRVRYDVAGEPNMAGFTLLHLGGVLQGDRADMCVTLGAGAAAQVVFAAATQIYHMPHGDAQHTLHLDLAPGSRLQWLAEPLILFAGADFTQHTTVTLGDGATLALLDVLVPGRLARGEQFQFRRYVTQMDVRDGVGRLLMAERAVLEPGRSTLGRPGMFGATPVVGSLYLLNRALNVEACAAHINQGADERIGATILPNDCGMLVRALGTSASWVKATLIDISRQVSYQRLMSS